MKPSLLLLVLGLSACAGAAGPNDNSRNPTMTQPPSEQTVRQWIKQLGDPSSHVREAATRSLIQAGPHAILAVHQTANSSDPEVARRAASVAEQVERNSAAALDALGASVQRSSADGRVRVVSLEEDRNNRVTDADLVHLWSFRALENLFLRTPRVTDAGMVHVGRLAGLRRLYLGEGVTDAGLARLGGLTSLEALLLEGTRTTGSGLAALKTLRHLEEVSLSRAPLTEAGVAAGTAGLREVKSLRRLALWQSDIDDACLAHVKKLKSLTLHQLGHSPITDAGLAHLKELPNLLELALRPTAVTDAGCTHLAAMKTLSALCLSGTRVTAPGLKQLEALPGLKRVHVAGREAVTLKEALALLAQPSPPQFGVIEEFDKESGIVLYAEHYPGVIEEEAVLPGPDGKKAIKFYRQRTETVRVRYSVKEGPVIDGEGKKLSAEAAGKRIAVGMTVVLSTDGKMIHPAFLKLFNKETLILVPAVPQPGPETAR